MFEHTARSCNRGARYSQAHRAVLKHTVGDSAEKSHGPNKRIQICGDLLGGNGLQYPEMLQGKRNMSTVGATYLFVLLGSKQYLPVGALYRLLDGC